MTHTAIDRPGDLHLCSKVVTHYARMQAALIALRGKFVGVAGVAKTLLPFLVLAAVAIYFLRLWALVLYAGLCAGMGLLLASGAICCGPKH